MNKQLILKSKFGLLVFFVIVFMVAWFGAQFPADQWYEALNKAPWNPPNWAFPIAWSILYCLIAIVGWLVFRTSDLTLKLIWVVQLLVNGVWSWLFFGLHRVDLALLNIIVMDGLLISFMLFAWQRGLKMVCLLWLPYVCWVLLATSLNLYILLAN